MIAVEVVFVGIERSDLVTRKIGSRRSSLDLGNSSACANEVRAAKIKGSHVVCSCRLRLFKNHSFYPPVGCPAVNDIPLGEGCPDDRLFTYRQQSVRALQSHRVGSVVTQPLKPDSTSRQKSHHNERGSRYVRSILPKISNLTIQAIESNPFNENTYVINRNGQATCLIIDPGFEPEKIIEHVRSSKLDPVAILNTHGHSDHIAGNEAIKQVWPEIPLIIGEGDAYKLTDPVGNLSAGFGGALVSPPADIKVSEGQTIEYADIPLEVYDTPGHSAGHVVFVFRSGGGDSASGDSVQDGPDLVIGGDVLFFGGVGRTDFPDGSHEQLVNSIHTKLFVLDGDTVVLPGHGPPTTIQQEIDHNPFVGVPAGYKK